MELKPDPSDHYFLQCFDTVGWVICPVKPVPDMAYNMFSGMLNPTRSISQWGNGRGCPLVMYYSEDLQLVHGFRCYDIIAPNANCQRVLVLALSGCIFVLIGHYSTCLED